MIDILNSDDRITFAELADRLPRDARGRKMRASTLIRHAEKGRGGVRLEAARVRTTWYTTLAAANTYFAARPASTVPPQPESPAPSNAEARRRAKDRARLDAILR